MPKPDTQIDLRCCRDGESKPRHPFDDHRFRFELRDGKWYVMAIQYASGWSWSSTNGFWETDAQPVRNYFGPTRPITPRRQSNTGPWLALAQNTLWAYLERAKDLA